MDIKKARELLEKAGYPQGLEVKLYFSPDRYPKAKEVCQVIADQLAKAGIKVELVSQEFVIFWGKEGSTGGSCRSTTLAVRRRTRTRSMINTTAPE